MTKAGAPWTGVMPVGVVRPYSFSDNLEGLTNDHIQYMLSRTQEMFKYEGLPDSIPARSMEIYLQTKGYAGFVKNPVNDLVYPFFGGLGSEPDVYYMPTKFIVANPAMPEVDGSYKIDEECVIIPNDSMYKGLIPMLNKWCTLIAQNEISMRICDVNTRITALISAIDNSTAESARKYLKEVENGKLGIIAETPLLDALKTKPYATGGNTHSLIDLIEERQYYVATMYNELGIQANFNMKREAINSSEAGMNDDVLQPFVDDMLKCRREGIEKLNKMFGFNISVSYNSSWLHDDVENMVESVENTEEEGEEENEESQT